MPAESLEEAESKPEKHQAVRLWLENGSRIVGMWTGREWWSVRGKVTEEVLRWEAED